MPSRRRAQGRTALTVRAVAAPVAAEPTAAVTLKACRRLQFGQVLKIVGGTPEMGNWEPTAAPAMSWSEGDVWFVTLDVPAGRHEFKVVVANGDGTHDWEGGPNRTLQVLAAVAASRTAFTVSCDEEPSAMASFGSSSGSNGNGNGGGSSLNSLATTLLRIEGYVADGVVSKEEAANFSAEQLDFLIRKRTKDAERAERSKNKSAAAALSRWAGLAPSTEEQEQREERRRLEEERAELERKQAELLAKATAAAKQRQEAQAAALREQAAAAASAAAAAQRAADAAPAPAPNGRASKWAALREGNASANGRAAPAAAQPKPASPAKPSAPVVAATSSSPPRTSYKPKTAATTTTTTRRTSSYSSGNIDWKAAAGVTGAIAVGAGAVLLAANVELTNPDGSKRPNPLGQGLQRLGVPSADEIKGKVGEWTKEQQRLLAAVQPPAAFTEGPKALRDKVAALGSQMEQALDKQRSALAPKYTPLSVSPEMNALRLKNFGTEEEKKAAAAKAPEPPKPAAAATRAPEPPRPAAQAPPPKPAPAPAAPKYEPPKQNYAPLRMSAEAKKLEQNRFTTATAASKKADASKAGAAAKKADAPSSSSKSGSKGGNFGLVSAAAAAVVLGGVLTAGKDFDLGSALRFRKLTDKELAELRAKELEVARAELEALKAQLRKERAEAAARLRLVQQQQRELERVRASSVAAAAASTPARGGGLFGVFGGASGAASTAPKQQQQKQKQQRAAAGTRQRASGTARRPAQQQQQRQQQGSRLPIPTFASVLAPLVFLSPSLLLMPDIAQGLSVASLLQDPEVGSEFAAELPATLEEQP